MAERETEEADAIESDLAMGVDDGSVPGQVSLSNDVFVTIVRHAALKVEGVLELCGHLSSGFMKRAGAPGIRIALNEEWVTIDLQVAVAHGVRIPQVAWQLQNDTREAVELMTGKHVKAVNVVVQAVRLPDAVPHEDQEGVGAL